MLFHFTINNPHPRVSRIWSYNFELYHVTNPNSMEIQFLGPLVPNLPFLPEWFHDFQQSQERPCELVWNYERKHIQSIEDSRHGDVFFEIKGNLLVASEYAGGAATQREVAWDSPYSNNAYPIRLKIAQSDWVSLLDEMKFTHILLHEFPAPAFHPAFARSAEHWREAWDHHRKNEPDSALMACFKAFECLGFELQGTTAVTRQQLVKSLLANEPTAKQDAFHDVLEKLTHFMHLGRHAKGHPSKVHRDDAEMILLCAASLLGYLSKQHARGSVPHP
ncbi:MAG TPA: hypothetical protein VN025_02885 [Candidatus Dormibacteraeota bacterium]|jgi:hypothetical protein|nr:hypothetical protein [Candidatus Dormibacteraeota bacterium]